MCSVQAMGWDNMAFVLLNRFLDIADMIEENNDDIATALDNSDFQLTDIPFDKLMIPGRPCVSSSHREQAKEWILAVSLDQRVAQVFIIFYWMHFTHIFLPSLTQPSLT